VKPRHVGTATGQGEKSVKTTGIMRHVALAAMAIGMTAAAPAGAALIDFDTLANSDDPIANGYAGLDWDNLFVLEPAKEAPIGGLPAAVVSGTKVAYAGYDAPATISGLAGHLLESAYFTAAFNNGLTIQAQGFNGNNLVHDVSFVVDTTGPTFYNFGWRDISKVVFTSSGGTEKDKWTFGTNFALDSLSVSAVPEPAAWATMILGLAVVGAAARTRSRRLCAAR
jgi:hypothetical protein